MMILPTSHHFAQHQKINLPLLTVTVILTLFGLLMVFDASLIEAQKDIGDRYYFIRQQSISALIGFLALGFFSFFDYHRLKKMALPIFLGALVLLLLVFIPGLGVRSGGAHRWISLGFMSIQPAEVVKLAVIIFFAAIFQKGARLSPFMMVLGTVGFILGILQKDLGTTVVFTIISFGIYFVSGANIVYFIGTLLMGFFSLIIFILTSSYRRQRILAFLDPFADPQGYTYHISQVLIALGSGGLFGLGVGQSRQKFAYIPEVTTDSIFSIVGEEFGLLGGIILIALFGFLVLKALKIAESAPDQFGKLLGVGISIWIGAQVAVNLGAMVSLIPLTGVPLPFISFGGSALLVNLVAIGILLNISKQSS